MSPQTLQRDLNLALIRTSFLVAIYNPPFFCSPIVTIFPSQIPLPKKEDFLL